MPTNRQELTALYKEIAAQEMVAKFEDCGLLWDKIAPYQYHLTLTVPPDFWDIYMTKMPGNEIITLDFVKNLRPFTTLNSSQDPNIQELYDSVSADDSYKRDQDLLADLHTIDRCGNAYWNIIGAAEGLLAAGSADELLNHLCIVEPAGVVVSGGYTSSNNIMNFYPSGGVWGDGTFTSNFNIWNITGATDGPLAGGMSFLINNVTVDSTGPLAAGSGAVQDTANITPTQGVQVSGSSITVATYKASAPTGGVWANGSATNTYTPSPVSVVQKNSVTQFTAGTTVSSSFTSQPAAGNTIVVCILSAVSITSVTDTAGNTYVADNSSSNSPEFFYCFRASSIATAAGLTITGNGSAGGNMYMGIMEVSGLSATPLDQHFGGIGTSSSISTGSITTTFANELVIAGMMCSDDTFTPEPSIPWINFLESVGAAMNGQVMYQITDATGTFSLTWSDSATPQWAAAITSYHH